MIVNEQVSVLSVLDHSPLATAVYNSPELHISYVNQAMLEMWCADHTILGETFCNCFPSFKQEGFSSILKNVWNTGISYQATDTPADIIDGNTKTTRYFDFEYKALVDEYGDTYAILHTAHDVTERKLVYNRIEQQNEEISFNHQLDLLANTLSHDLKNPLAVLKMGNDFLTRNPDMCPTVHKKWNKNIADAIQNIEAIINQTLELSKARKNTNQQEYIAMDRKIQNCLAEVQLLYPQLTVSFRLGHLYAIHANKAMIYQIFVNLIANAVKYAKKTTADYLHIYSEQTDKGIVYFLEDNGIGIPEDELNQVFLAHERASNSTHTVGTGIGLSLVKRLIERLGGTINLSSQLGKGTIIRLFFPYV
ncbi:MAG: PAS domain-containing sensor histidine kinase [Sphingobacterium sp.]|jgi:signal transduction histidine kinase|nr:PAS domain-containing sensor histidine kinase [Sphingobacterium sp.]